MKRELKAQQIAGALALYSIGCRVDEILGLYGITKPTLFKWVADYKPSGPNRNYIPRGKARGMKGYCNDHHG